MKSQQSAQKNLLLTSMGAYPEGLRIRWVLINAAELFQSDLKTLAFSFSEWAGKEEDVTMWEHFDAPSVLLGDFI